MSRNSAELIELFSSIQGEGILVGRRQLFLRFAGCNLDCSYCDTSHAPTPYFRMESVPGSGKFDKIPNPVALETVAGQLASINTTHPRLHHSLSITGGEPLIHAETLAEWLPVLRSYLPIFLETNGTLHAELTRVIDQIDYISMDIKLPSSAGITETLWHSHRAFLEIASIKECYVKVVVSLDTTHDEIQTAAELIAAQNYDIPLIIQPVTAQVGNPLMGSLLLSLQERASILLSDVRVIPQLHAFMQVL